MKTEEEQNYFHIEGFFRTRSTHKSVLELDAIILSDLDDSAKMAEVSRLISETVEVVQQKEVSK